MVLIRVFGPLEMEVEGGPVELPASRRARALLAWLALQPGRHTRAKVAAQFWPDVLDSSARTSLRGAVRELRKSMGSAADVLVTTRETIELSGPPAVRVDAREFDTLVAGDRPEAALDLVRGPLLSDIDDEWVDPFRDEYDRKLRGLLEQLSQRAEQEGRLSDAAELARRRVDLDPLSEPASRELIRLLDSAGDRAGALAAANALIDRLHRDLGLGPDPETLGLVARVRSAEPAQRSATQAPAQVPAPPAVARHDVTLIGRDAELRRIQDAAQAAARTGASAVVVSGDAGIGKTSLALTAAAAAARDGQPVLYGRCDEESIVPFEPWVEAIGNLIEHQPDDRLAALAHSGGAALAQLLPRLRGLSSTTAGSVQDEPDTERWRLFEAISGLLHEACAAGGMLVIDDAQWADRSTLLLLRHVLRSRRSDPILVLLTCRSSELPTDTYLRAVLAELRRDAMLTEIELTGLSEPGVAELVTKRRGAPAKHGFVQALHQETDGNPFFVEEILRGTPTAAAVDDTLDSSGFPVPQGVRDVIHRRLSQLPASITDVLTHAAVAGRDFDLDLLDRLVRLDYQALLEHLDQAVAAGVLDETGVGRYSFSHGLFRSVLYDGLTRTRRARLHLAVAQALESLSGDGDDRVGEIAHHCLAAAEPAYLDVAIDYARQAYEHAMNQLAYEEAAAIAQRAVDTLDQAGDESIAAVELPQMLMAVGDAQSSAGDFVAARHAYGRVVEIAERDRNPMLLANAALGVGGPSWRSFGEVDSEAIDLLERALKALPQSEVSLRTTVQARLAIKLYFARTPERVAELTDAAVTDARMLNDPAVLAAALEARLWANWSPDGVRERLDAARELLQLAERHRMQELAVVARRWRVVALLESGRLTDARAEIAEHARAARTLRLPYELMYVAVFSTMRALLEGRLDDAARDSARVAAFGELRGGADAVQFVGVHQLTFGLLRGELAVMVDAARTYADGYPAVPAWRAGLAYALTEAGRPADARAEVERLWPPESALSRDAAWLVAVSVLAMTVTRLGDRARAEHLYQLLIPYADRPVVLGAGGAIWGTGALYLGMLSAVLGDAERAVEHLSAAAEWLRRAGAAPWLAVIEATQRALQQAAGAPQPA